MGNPQTCEKKPYFTVYLTLILRASALWVEQIKWISSKVTSSVVVQSCPFMSPPGHSFLAELQWGDNNTERGFCTKKTETLADFHFPHRLLQINFGTIFFFFTQNEHCGFCLPSLTLKLNWFGRPTSCNKWMCSTFSSVCSMKHTVKKLSL